jgi:hypothetical protein
MGTIKTFVAGLALFSLSAMPVMAEGPAAGPVQQVGLFSKLTKKDDDCAKDSKKGADKKSADAKKAGCDNGRDNGCYGDGNGDGCDLLQRAMNRTGLGRRLSDKGVRVSGYLQLGYHSDSTGGLSSHPRDNTGGFNSHPDALNLHQMYLAIEKLADEDAETGLGFRVDLVYGVDAQDMQSFGNEAGSSVFDDDADWDHGVYGWAMPQLYATVVRGDLSVKAGHFFGGLGLERVNPNDNKFYSRSKAMNRSQPRTLTGFMADYNITDDLTTSFGWTAGWDTGFDRGNDGDSSDGSTLIAVASFELVEDEVSVTYAVTMGDLGSRGEGYVHSVYAELEIEEEIYYGIESVLVETNSGSLGHDHTVGISQILYTSITDDVSGGMRIEWWKKNGQSEYDLTFGLNIKASDCVIIRPEVRTDWGAATATGEEDQSVFGVDVILTY